MHRRSQAPITPNAPTATAKKPTLSILETERILSQQEAERKECLERAQALEERYKQTKDETLIPRIQTLRAAAEASSPAPETVSQPTPSGKVLEQSRLQKEIQAKWERRSPEDLLREAKSLVEEYKRSHDDTLLPQIQALRKTANERAKSPWSKLVIPPSAKKKTSWGIGNISLKHLKYVGIAGIPIFAFILFVLFITNRIGGNSEADTHIAAMEAKAVQATKDNFEPAYDMLILNPDTTSGNWFAIENTWGYTCQGECYVVFYKVDVMPSGATEMKRMEFKWLYDTKRPSPVPANTEARTYFQPK
jgi:hypothetical protein